jgi:hypothetical protein
MRIAQIKSVVEPHRERLDALNDLAELVELSLTKPTTGTFRSRSVPSNLAVIPWDGCR